MHKINVGLIGAGRIGRVHGEHLARRIPEANLVAVSDIFLNAAEKLAADFQIPAIFQDYRRIMEDEAIEAVVISSSTDTHTRMIEEAAAAGKHIFCEKPLAIDLIKIDRALAAVRQAGVKLQVGFNRRFDSDFRRVQEIVAAGEIGTPHILRITSRDPELPSIAYVEVSGGIFLDMTAHDFDTARYLIGSEVEEVFAVGGVLVNPEIGRVGDFDTAIITLRFVNGTLGAIDNSRRAIYGYDQRVEVFGSKGMAVVANKTSDNVSCSDAQGIHAARLPHFFVDRYIKSFEEEIRAFIRCVLEDKTPLVTGVDGRASTVMSLAARKSCEEHRPVRLSEVDTTNLSPISNRKEY